MYLARGVREKVVHIRCTRWDDVTIKTGSIRMVVILSPAQWRSSTLSAVCSCTEPLPVYGVYNYITPISATCYTFCGLLAWSVVRWPW
jgi:hypothetical protein